ncbi:hypothetical protein D3C85_1465220 [compost metagenome]
MAVELVQHGVELFHRAYVQACDKAVIAGDLVALGELGNGHDLPFNLLQLPRQRPHPHNGLQLVTEAARVDLHRVALEHAALLQPAQAFTDAGRRQTAELRQGLERAPRVFHQCLDQQLVNVVGHTGLVRQKSKTALIVKVESQSSLFYQLERAPAPLP